MGHGASDCHAHGFGQWKDLAACFQLVLFAAGEIRSAVLGYEVNHNVVPACTEHSFRHGVVARRILVGGVANEVSVDEDAVGILHGSEPQ